MLPATITSPATEPSRIPAIAQVRHLLASMIPPRSRQPLGVATLLVSLLSVCAASSHLAASLEVGPTRTRISASRDVTDYDKAGLPIRRTVEHEERTTERGPWRIDLGRHRR